MRLCASHGHMCVCASGFPFSFLLIRSPRKDAMHTSPIAPAAGTQPSHLPVAPDDANVRPLPPGGPAASVCMHADVRGVRPNGSRGRRRGGCGPVRQRWDVFICIYIYIRSSAGQLISRTGVTCAGTGYPGCGESGLVDANGEQKETRSKKKREKKRWKSGGMACAMRARR